MASATSELISYILFYLGINSHMWRVTTTLASTAVECNKDVLISLTYHAFLKRQNQIL